MAITLTAPLCATSITTYAYSSTATISLTASLSAVSTLVSPPLSGNSLVSVPILLFNAVPNTGGITLSASPAGISLVFGSNTGAQIFYGALTSSTLSTVASTFTANVSFVGNDFRNTMIVLSGTSTTGNISTLLSTIDNPFYITTFTGNNNVSFRTVDQHCRKWNLNG